MTESLTFAETFTVTADTPLLAGHVVYGRSLMPGVGYVDLVLQALARNGLAMPDAELRSVMILAPLVAAPGEHVVVTVEGRPVSTGECRIEVRGRRPGDTADVVHAVVAAHPRAAAGFEERLSLPLSGLEGRTPLTDIYTWSRAHELVHSGSMKVDGVVHHRAGDWIAELELPEAGRADADAYLFHPALFEAGLLGGGVAVGLLHEGSDDPGLYLPLVLESFRATAPLGERCFVRVPADSVRRDEELIRLAVEFYDASGAKVAELGQLVAKRIRVAGALDGREPRAGDSAADARTAAGAPDRDLVALLRELVADRVGRPPAAIDVRAGYYELGLASAELLALVSDLESRLALPLEPTIMFEYKTIAELAAWLQTRLAEHRADGPDTTAQTPAEPAPRSDTASPEVLSTVCAAVVDDVAALLSVPVGEVEPGRELWELGLDWTSLAQLADRLNERYGLALAATLFADYRTVQAVAAHLVDAHGDRVAAGHPASLQHPMLHRVERDGDRAVYETRFDGSEPFLRDHRVHGSRVLPAVVHLEMARAAVARTLGEEDAASVQLDDVVWLRPAICGPHGLKLCVSVHATPGGGCEYAIHAGEQLSSQGRASLARTGDQIRPRLDDLRTACAEAVFPAAHIYGLYARAGLDYGSAQRSLVEIGVGTDDAGLPQVLAELQLPAARRLDGCRLHPSVVDGALQATIGLWLTAASSDRGQPGLALPFALQHVRAPAAIPTKSYAWVRHQRGSGTSARLDVTVFDEQGQVCVDLTGLSLRAVPDATPAAPAPAPAPAPSRGDIAIVGVSGRYPEAADLDEFWRNLRSGRDCIREIPAERWDHRRYAEAVGSATGRWGGFLDGIDRFDPLFFRISMLEAEYLDPQERLFLECAHHCLEDAGYTGESLARSLGAAASARVGVFVGVMYQEYQLFGAQAQARGHSVALSGSASTIANRVSYFHDFSGPSMAVDTMCSSSLTAIHLACEAIKSGQCEAAIAGGVNLSPHPNKYLMLGQRRFLSSDGRCRSFGEGGDGYVPGEGVGAVLLTSHERAVADGDHIYGVIKGTAVNHGGRTPGYSVPSPTAQAEVIAGALAAAGVDPRSLSYVEAHGTGTSLGDPIEIAGLAKAFHEVGGLPEHCAIGSVKSNIGHGESAAGIAGVTKVLLQMQHGELVPSLHSATLNPHIDLDRTPLRIPQSVEPWKRPTLEIDDEQRTVPRIAGVSGFGAGGSNAHVIIAEHDPHVAAPAPSLGDGRPALFVLSARSADQLLEQARRLHARLGELSDGELLDVAWTLQTGRMALEERLAFAATSLEDARSRLSSFLAEPGRPAGWVRGTFRPERETPGDEALRSAVREWTDTGVYDRLLVLWAEGAAVEWESTYPMVPPARRISLPGYPFARERCWLDLAAEPDASIAARDEQPAEPVSSQTGDGPAPSAEMVLLRPVLTELDSAPADAIDEPRREHHVVVIGRLAGAEREALRAALPAGAACELVEPLDGSLADQYIDVTRSVFTLTRGILERGVRQPVLLQVALVAAATERERLACFAGLAGLLKTAHQENPLLHAQYLECLDGASPASVGARLASEAAHRTEPEVRHRDGRRYVERLEEVASPRAAAVPWKEGGVYLITGGAGALGLIVARDIAASVRHATVVLTGRSPLNEARRSALDALHASGLTVDYQPADVVDRTSVAGLLAHVERNHGPLTGILHSAGVVEDNLIVRKSADELVRVLAPKVTGLVNLDELSRDQPLELFLCFSSATGAFGNPGQADYAAANAFMDAYAGYRNGLVEAGLRSGRTVSIGWPLWDDGGMGQSAEVRQHLRSIGLAPLDTARGLLALRSALAAEDNALDSGRLLVFVGRRGMALPLIAGREPSQADERPARDEAPAPAGASQDSSRALEDSGVRPLQRILAGALKLAPERVDADTPLERYGMDSVIAMTVVSRLEESFGPLSRTLLFEEQTVRELARYFAANHAQALRALVGEPAVAQRTPAVPHATATTPAPQMQAAAPDRAGPGTRTQQSARERGPDAGNGRGAEVAIVGISGRYPQADDLDAFWANLRSGRDCVTELPGDRFDGERRNGGNGTGHPYWGAFLDGIDRFDPLFFGISPREAAAMDPQQRLFLETVWRLLEESGVTQEVIEQRYGRRVGVYVGAAYQMYRADEADPGLAALTSATSYNLIANRVSYFFGLEGPSLAVDSMCTSSAMAVHLACADLQRGESELAIAGGVNLTVHPDKYVALSEMSLLGTHAGSRSFRDGDGYLPAEAVGALLLKPLDAAIRDGDTIHAVITGSASLHGGRANGFMTPSHRAQVNVMRRALERAGAEPSSIGYVETAANGSTLADEVEFSALRQVFDGVTEPVALGTVKSNLGHPEAASGIAQLTKVALQLRHGELPPLVEVGSPNTNLNLDGTPLRLCDRLSRWEPRGTVDGGRPAPRRALVNSVAAGGSHVSLVVEEPPAIAATGPDAEDVMPQLVVLSAKSPERLRVATRRLHDFLERDGSVGLAGLAYTTQLAREAMPERLAVVVGSREELKRALADHLAGEAGVGTVARVHLGNADDGGGLGALLSGLRGEELMAGLVADGDLERLAELWVCGARVPWDALHPVRRRLVPIPPTAFESGRYWVGRTPGGPAAVTSNGHGPTALDRQDPTHTDTQRLLAAVWAELLLVDADQLGPTSNFFSLGGNSLLANRLINVLKDRVGVELPVKAVLDGPRLADMSAALEQRMAGAGPAGPIDADRILESIALIESMGDDELDALRLEN